MIAKIGAALTDILKKNLSDILPEPGQIGVYQPNDRGEIALGLYLFSIRNCSEVNMPSIAAVGRNIKDIPPRFLTLYYLLTAHSRADLAYRTLEEHRILSRAIAAFESAQTLTESILGFKPGNWVDGLKLQFVDFDSAQMSNIWGVQEKLCRLSVVYKVCPVEVSVVSGKISQRVGSADTSFTDKKG